MRRLLPLLLLAIILLPAFVHASLPFIEKDGEPVAALIIEMRPRWEIEGRDFNDDTGLSDYGTMRSMIGIDIMPLDNFSMRMIFQESRYLGTQPPDRAPAAQMEMREAYFRVDNLFAKNIAVQAGRFTWETGRGRVFGLNDWRLNGPNAYDGMILEWPCSLWPDKGRWSLLAARVYDNDFAAVLSDTMDPYEIPDPWESPYEQDKRDRTLVALSGDFLNGLLQPFISADLDGREFNRFFLFDYWPQNRYHGGIYIGDTWDNVTFNVDAVYQWGEVGFEQIKTDETGRELDRFHPTLKSWLLAADVSYEFKVTNHPMVGFGFDGNYGSWELDESIGAGSTGDNFPYFQTPFASQHEFRGAMDINWNYIPRLVDYFVAAGLNPTEDLNLNLTYHRFIAVDENRYRDETIDIGHEIDLELTLQMNKYLEIRGGYSTFIIIGDNWYGLQARQVNQSKYGGVLNRSTGSSDYAWLQASVRF